MKKPFVLLAMMFAIVSSTFITSSVVQAAGNGVVSISCDASAQTFTLTVDKTKNYNGDHLIQPNGDDIHFTLGTLDAGNTYTFHNSAIQDGTQVKILGVIAVCTTEPVTFCDLSADGRYDGLCGDRVVVYCNIDEGTYTIFGIDNDSVGLPLGTFSHDDLQDAGHDGLSKSGVNGTISISENENGDFYAAWTGGPVGADGLKDFAKSGNCGF